MPENNYLPNTCLVKLYTLKNVSIMRKSELMTFLYFQNERIDDIIILKHQRLGWLKLILKWYSLYVVSIEPAKLEIATIKVTKILNFLRSETDGLVH